MEIKDIKKKQRRNVPMSIRTTPEISKWMKEHNISPTALFHQAAMELIEKMEKQNNSTRR